MTGSSTSALRSRYCFRCRRTWRARALRRAPHGARRLRRERTAGRESAVLGTAPPPPAAAAAPCAGAAAACRSQSASRPCRASARPPAAPLAPHARRQAPRRLLRARRHPQARSSGPRRAHSASTCASAGAAGSPVARARPGRLARARSRAVKRGRRGRRRGLAERAHLQLPLLGLCGLREDVDDERSPVSHAAGRQLLRRPSTASASGRGSGRRCRSGAPSPSPGCAAARGSARRQRSLRTPARWSRAGSAAAQELWRQPPLRACVGLQLGQLGRQLRKLASAQVCPLQGARPVSCSPARPMSCRRRRTWSRPARRRPACLRSSRRPSRRAPCVAVFQRAPTLGRRAGRPARCTSRSWASADARCARSSSCRRSVGGPGARCEPAQRPLRSGAGVARAGHP